MKPLKKKRVFSKEEADALLPELERRLKLLRAKKETYSRTHDLLFMHHPTPIFNTFAIYLSVIIRIPRPIELSML